MAFQHIVNGSVLSSEVVLLKDTQTLSSRLLTFHFLSSWIQSKSVPQITALLLEQSPNTFMKQFGDLPNQAKVKIVDASSDARGWGLKEKPEAVSTTNLGTLFASLKSLVPEKSTSVLYIDSINHLLLNGHSESQVAVLLTNLKQCFSSVIAVTHLDALTSPTFVQCLESVSSCIIEVVRPPSLPMVDVTGSFSILQKRKSGKVNRTDEHYHLPKHGNTLTFYTDAQVIKKEVTAPPENKFKDKMDQLTPEQEAARASVALPYMKARESASQSVSGLPEHTLDVPAPGTVYVNPEDVDPDEDYDDDF